MPDNANETTTVHLHKVTPSDVPDVAQLYSACFDDDWGIASIRSLMAVPGTWGLLATKQNAMNENGSKENAAPTPVGFILARVIAGEGEILSIGTHPKHRKSGVAATLLTKLTVLAAPFADAIFLEVGTDNPAAIALYHKFGYRDVGRRKGYYRRPGGITADALIMRLDLPKRQSSSQQNA